MTCGSPDLAKADLALSGADRRGWGDALGLEELSARSLKCDLISPPKGYSIPSLGQSESAPAPHPPPPMGGPGPGSTLLCWDSQDPVTQDFSGTPPSYFDLEGEIFRKF